MALDAAAGVIALHTHDGETQGPELVWYPTLRQVAARRRQVTYGTPVAGDVQRGVDSDQPFLVEIVVPCHVQTASGDGVAYAGDAAAPTEPISDRLLPQATIASDADAVATELRPAVLAAVASCIAAESVRELVQITLVFAFQRDRNAVVLVRHLRTESPRP